VAENLSLSWTSLLFLSSLTNSSDFITLKKFLPLPSFAFSIALVAILHSCNSGDGIKPAGELL
jgi:hypothetical protein